MGSASARRQAADFEQFEPEGLDLGEYAEQRGLVRQRSGQRGVLSARLSPQAGERDPLAAPVTSSPVIGLASRGRLSLNHEPHSGNSSHSGQHTWPARTPSGRAWTPSG
jgi:hypothetical protein